ncbi:DUF4832 domain-containing protein [Parafilimonas sp.]|uniref:DUF4832 domain-containing protein n=1 Tax=Parafilimonas sp. TaxID=1969739 RepID=UPI0039E64370
MNNIKLTCAAALLIFLTQCSKIGNPVLYTPPATDTVYYDESDDDFANPERGFYYATETYVSNYEPLDAATMKTWRTLQQASDGNYKIYSTLVFRNIILDGFTNKDLTQDVLNNISADFNSAREAGMKLILRFCYTITANSGACPEGFICPAYGDAPKSIVLAHIAQLKSLLQDNADVIACMQMGFVGTWGENYYSDYFGDPSSNGSGKLSDENWSDKSEVLKALLDALPQSRMIQVRTPQMKQRYVYGVDAPTSSAALTETEAFSGSDIARIGFHNDCFLSSATDYGTYDDYGNSSTERGDAYSILHTYAAADGKYTVVGGETCDDTYSPENNCENSGKAQTEMANMHYSFLNSAYNNDVNNDWETEGCMDAIKKNLGYRFVLRDGVFPEAPVKAGMQLAFALDINNVGYASPYNERPLQVIMRNQSTKEEFTFDVNEDVRKWYTGNHSVNIKIITDNSMPAGDYDLLLNLPDAASSLANMPEYSIRFANDNVWEEATGYNKLNVTITIQ